MIQLPSDTLTLFKCHHFERLLITQALRCYITSTLSYPDVSHAALTLGGREVAQMIKNGQARHFKLEPRRKTSRRTCGRLS